MSNEPIAPKACPFCGHVGLSFSEGSSFRWLAYSCPGCGIGGETRILPERIGDKEETQARQAQAEQDAITLWNRRVELYGNSEELRTAAQAVVERWGAPNWKDIWPTREAINRLRDVLVSESSGDSGELRYQRPKTPGLRETFGDRSISPKEYWEWRAQGGSELDSQSSGELTENDDSYKRVPLKPAFSVQARYMSIETELSDDEIVSFIVKPDFLPLYHGHDGPHWTVDGDFARSDMIDCIREIIAADRALRPPNDSAYYRSVVDGSLPNADEVIAYARHKREQAKDKP